MKQECTVRLYISGEDYTLPQMLAETVNLEFDRHLVVAAVDELLKTWSTARGATITVAIGPAEE